MILITERAQQLLLINGLSVDHVTIANAVEYGHLDIVEMFLQNGANNEVTYGSSGTLVAIAVRHDNIEMVKLLIKYGTKIDPPPILRFEITMFTAFRNNNLDMMKVLVENNASVNGKDSLGETLLSNAIRTVLSTLKTVLLLNYCRLTLPILK